MSKLELVIYPDDRLTVRCKDITQIDQPLLDLLDQMAETMYASRGIGLAAPQVASDLRVITVDVDQGEGEGLGLLKLVNPVIVDSHGRTTFEEGCLSFPGLSAEVRRKKQIHLQAYDPAGRAVDLDLDGLASICVQHEIDHLNGVTFVDRLSPVSKRLVLREYLRERAEEEEEAALASVRRTHEAP